MSDDKALDHLRAADPILAALIDQIGPPRIHRHDDHFHALVSSIVSQQVSTHAAAAIMGRVLDLAAANGTLSPAQILEAGEMALRTAGLSRMKAAYALDLANKVHSKALDLEHIATHADEEVIAALTQVKGIGRWTAQMFLIFSLGRPDVLPVDDLGFRTAVKRAYGFEELPAPADLHALAATWAPYRSYATWYLWRSLNNVPQADEPT